MSDNNDNAGIITHPPFFYIIAALIAVGIDWLYPLSFGGDGMIKTVAIVLVVVGVLAFIMAGRMFAKNKQSPSVHASQPKIITSGIYGYTRNPIYLIATVWLGAAGLYVDNVWMVLMVIPMIIVINKLVIEKEEAYLESKFGDEYRDYKKKVRRWI